MLSTEPSFIPRWGKDAGITDLTDYFYHQEFPQKVLGARIAALFIAFLDRFID